MAQTWRYGIKCLKCGLHFNVYSWIGDWLDNLKEGPACPECGQRGAICLSREPIAGEIYQQVP